MAQSFMYVFGLCLVLTFAEYAPMVAGISATCQITAYSGVGPVSGEIHLSQPVETAGTTVTVKVLLNGFNSSYPAGTLHGFHVHEKNDLGNSCNNTGGHYNPYNVSHGGPTDSIRHVGDLGNVAVDANGQVNTTITDSVISLVGDQSIIGRAFVVHEMQDDLGLGNYSDSKTTGHAGRRLGCCVITLDSTGMATSFTPQIGLVVLSAAVIALAGFL